MGKAHRLLALIGCVVPTGLAAEIVPVKITWTGVKPAAISVAGPTGLVPLAYDSQAKAFRAQISITGNAPERRSFVVNYGSYNAPLDVRVHRVLPSISFTVERQPQASCTRARVQAVEGASNTLPDAIGRALSAGELLSIQRPNDCDASLRFAATRARYRQNVRMNHLSFGLFMINPEIAREYQDLAAERGLSVTGELAAYAQAEKESEAVQLIYARQGAQDAMDFVRAAAINNYIEQRIAGSSDVRSAYANVGIIGSQVSYDGRYLAAVAGSASIVSNDAMAEASDEAEAQVSRDVAEDEVLAAPEPDPEWPN